KSEDEPKLITYYGGSGDPPIIDNPSGGWSCNGTTSIDHIAIVGVHFTDSTREPGGGSFDPVAARKFVSLIRANAPMNGLLLESCWFGWGDVEIINEISNFRFRRNVCLGNYVAAGGGDAGLKAFNLYVSNHGNSFTVEENIFDFGGWHPDVDHAGRQALAHN